jgi:chemotaxis protein histidine kinase CheA
VLDSALQQVTPQAVLCFDISSHPTKIAMVEALKGQTGVLALERLTITSFDTEEHLLFSAFRADGTPLDHEQCEKLFQCRAEISQPTDLKAATQRLTAETDRHAAATIARALETSNRHFQEEREKLEKWADDLVLASEKELKETKARLKLLNRQARQAATTTEQVELQKQIVELEKKQRKQRQRIFDVEDQIIERRDALIARLEQQMTQKTKRERLFTIGWAVV